MVVIIVAVIAIASGGGDDDDERHHQRPPTGDNSDLPADLPGGRGRRAPKATSSGARGATPSSGCVKVPISNAAPCVEPWDETEDNGGATAQGVTADEIVVVNYKGQPDPLQQALVEDAGADTDPDANNEVEVDYINMFADVYETYGRTVRIETIEASGGPDDATAAQADALQGHRPRAVRGRRRPDDRRRGPQEIADAGIVCVGCGTHRERRQGRRERALLVADRPEPRAGRCPPRRDGRQAARRQAGRVRRRRGDAARGARVRLDPGRDRDRRVQGAQRRLRGAARRGVRR